MGLQFGNVESQKLKHLGHWPDNPRVDMEKQKIHMGKLLSGREVWLVVLSCRCGGLLRRKHFSCIGF